MDISGPQSQIYDSLPPRTFRTFVLNPGRLDEPLSGCFRLQKLADVDRSTAYPFTALSYVWGEPEFPREIRYTPSPHDSEKVPQPLFTEAKENVFDRGIKINITQNLFDALIYLRDPEEVKTFWIDALCINQHDLDEKAHQLPLMRNIFEDAEDVIISLGSSIPRFPEGMRLLQRAAYYAREENGGRPLVLQLRSEALTASQLQQIGFPDVSDRVAWYPLIDILAHPWFSRIWTVQESLLPQAPIMQHRDSKIPLTDFVDALSFFLHKEMPGFDVLFRSGIYDFMDRWHAYPEFKARPYNVLEDRSMLFRMAQRMYATEPRDKFYALLGLVDRESRDQIVPDYRKPVAEVYAEMIKWTMNRVGAFALYFLESIDGFYGHSSEFPSWVPQFDAPISVSPNVSLGRSCDAGGPMTVLPSFTDHSLLVLPLQGFIYSTINKIIPYNVPSRSDHDQNTRMAASIRILRKAYDEFGPGGDSVGVEDFEDLLARTAIPQGNLVEHQMYNRFFTQYALLLVNVPIIQECMRARYQNERLWPQAWTAEHIASADSLMDAILEKVPMQQIQRFFLELMNHLERGRLMNTVSGHVMFGSPISQENDIVCVLYGLQCPCILRPTGNGQFWYLGACYLDGIMLGEALEKGRTQERLFELV